MSFLLQYKKPKLALNASGGIILGNSKFIISVGLTIRLPVIPNQLCIFIQEIGPTQLLKNIFDLECPQIIDFFIPKFKILFQRRA